MNAPTPELAKQLRAIEAGNRHDREWMADRLDEIVFLCDIVSSHSISAREAARRGDQPLLGTHLRHAREGMMLAIKTFKVLPPETSEGSAG